MSGVEFSLSEQVALTPMPPGMEKELVQVQEILRRAYKKIDKLDLIYRSPVIAACFLEQTKIAIDSVIEPVKGTKAYENTAYAISKVLRSIINQHMSWDQFLDYCEKADEIDHLLEIANKLDGVKSGV